MSDVAPPGYLGDYYASTHLQGEMIGDLLDMIIRNATNGKQNIDDLMRKMFEQFCGAKGFSGIDVEHAINQICNCDVHSFFENYIRGNKMIGFEKYLMAFGLKMNITKKALLGGDKKPVADGSIYAWNDAAAHSIKLGITNPQGCWAKAGLHTGDVLLKMNDSAVRSNNDFYSWLDKLKPGDTVNIEIKRKDKINSTKVYLTTQYVTLVNIESLPKPSGKQGKLYAEWMMGK
jgi:predicted metalloprotease with PDZ domain